MVCLGAEVPLKLLGRMTDAALRRQGTHGLIFDNHASIDSIRSASMVGVDSLIPWRSCNADSVQGLAELVFSSDTKVFLALSQLSNLVELVGEPCGNFLPDVAYRGGEV
jgi:hypothetical protein